MGIVDLLETAIAVGDTVQSAKELKEATVDTAVSTIGNTIYLSNLVSKGAAAKDKLDEMASRPLEEKPGVLGVLGVAGKILLDD